MTDITQESLQKKQEAIDLLAKRYRGMEQRTEDICKKGLFCNLRLYNLGLSYAKAQEKA
jgi:hypothetical protein